MAKQVVNSDAIASVANKLRTINGAINGEFEVLRKKAELLSGWKGLAGTAAGTAVYEIFKSSAERSKVIQNYINILEQQISPGYINTETVNTKLADKFK